MILLNILITIYLCIGSFIAGAAWEDTDQLPFRWRTFIVFLHVSFLPLVSFLGIVWKGIVWLVKPIDNYFQISFYLSFYIFNTDSWIEMEKTHLQNIYQIIKSKRNTNSLKDKIYRHAASKMFQKNSFIPDENYVTSDVDKIV